MNNNNWSEYISTDSKIMFGKPTIRGTRIPVDLILEKLSDGETITQLLKAYPRITVDAIYACSHFAEKNIKDKVVTMLN